MNYWILYARDQAKGEEVNIKVQNETIVHKDFHHLEKAMKMNADGFKIYSSKVALAGDINNFYRENNIDKWERIISKGITTTLFLMNISKQRELEQCQKEADDKLQTPIDYVLVPSIPSGILTPEFIQTLIIKSYPVIEVCFATLDDCKYVPWDWIRQAVGPASLSFIFRFPVVKNKKEKNQKGQWASHLSMLFHVLPFDNGPILSKNEMQMTGIYPKKGSLVRGDADYLLYYNVNADTTNLTEQAEPEPDIVALRGKIIKAGSEYHLSKGYGKHCENIFPGRLRSINFV
ncbi:hypothetical protein D7Z54_10830 [Salibacterium salarium]|uniref:Uncharacterized protein n=1 Tax=Salibacterium salarium TaxID=284579 RepID=A0A428N4X4_9BACI|nr:hypothetical protein [Salibacterium salarium]RSL33451.1 hypothetical protein D7Z54_10830 [Salibacterium salarium]